MTHRTQTDLTEVDCGIHHALEYHTEIRCTTMDIYQEKNMCIDNPMLKENLVWKQMMQRYSRDMRGHPPRRSRKHASDEKCT